MFHGFCQAKINIRLLKVSIAILGMKAISSSKYEHLQGAMKELAYLVSEQKVGDIDDTLNRQIAEKREQLKVLYKHYSEMLNQLEQLTHTYEELAMDIKINLLGKQLKEIKKQISPGCPSYQHFGLSVQLLYGT